MSGASLEFWNVDNDCHLKKPGARHFCYRQLFNLQLEYQGEQAIWSERP